MITGKERRLRRLLREDGRTLLVAVDHSVTTGPAGGLAAMRPVLNAVVAGGADGIVMHRGSAARSMPVQRDTALVVHLSGNTALNPRPELKAAVCEPEAALALGADGLSVHITLGGGPAEDRAALADLGRVALECDRLGLPLLVMTYVAGEPASRGAAVVHAARVAAELGADIVKAAHPGRDRLAELAASIDVPVVVAGGDADGTFEDFLRESATVLSAGLAGLCVGRRVFGHPDPASAAARLVRLVHGEPDLRAGNGMAAIDQEEAVAR